MQRRFPGLAVLSPRWLVGASVLATGLLAAIVWFALRPGSAGTWYASFLVQEGERAWEPVDIDRAVDKIEAFQELENRGLQNMLLELDQDPHGAPGEAELERLWTLYEASWRAAEEHGWFDYRNAVRDGFVLDPNDPTHYPHPGNLTDRRTVDPDRPEFLMYYPAPGNEYEKFLAGFMFQQSAFDQHGEQIGGPLTRWHKHIYGAPVCFGRDMIPHGVYVEGECDGVKTSESPEMLHVWFVEHPESQFASRMSLVSNPTATPTMMTKEAFLAKHRGQHAGPHH